MSRNFSLPARLIVGALVVVEASFLAWLWLHGGSGAQATASPVPFSASVPDHDPPNVLLIVTDDQRWDTLAGMPIVGRTLADHGIRFANAFVSNPLCCPSRSSILTGDYSHTTLVYRQIPPYGRFDWFNDRSTLATWLHDAGYSTGFFGKYLDGYQHAALTRYIPPGWDRWVAFVHSGYYDYRLSIDGAVSDYGERPDEYSTRVLTENATSFIRGAKGPLFLEFAPAAPHAPAIPAPQDQGAPKELDPWRPPSFNESDVSDKPAWLRTRPPLSNEQVSEEDVFRVDQYRTLRAVDRSVGELLEALAATGRLSNTLIIFTSDNGLAWGEHRWVKKEVPYEESIRVPLIVRYDGLIDGHRVDRHLVLNIDIAPTIAEVTGVGRPSVDGRSLVPLIRSSDAPWRRDFLIEHMRGTNPVPTYCGVRTARFMYARYVTGERELYDLDTDPYELRNQAEDPDAAPTVAALDDRLDVLCDPPPPGFVSESRTGTVAATVLIPLGTAGLLVLVWRRRGGSSGAHRS